MRGENVTMVAGVGVIQGCSTSQRKWVAREAQKDKETNSYLELQKEFYPIDTLILQLLTSRTVR